jgi:hypothetical protein
MDFPIYKIVHDLFNISEDRIERPGESAQQAIYEDDLRVIIHGFLDPLLGVGQQKPLDDIFVSALKPTDIVFISLYSGECGRPGIGTSSKLPQYERNLEIINHIASKVSGIILGNAMMELSFRGTGGAVSPEDNIEKCCNFVDETSNIIMSAGGRPVYGPINADLAQDCFLCNGKLRDKLNSVDALSICYCASWLFLQALPLDCQVPGATLDKLRNYLHGMNVICDMEEDILTSSVDFLKWLGFSGGI